MGPGALLRSERERAIRPLAAATALVLAAALIAAAVSDRTVDPDRSDPARAPGAPAAPVPATSSVGGDDGPAQPSGAPTTVAGPLGRSALPAPGVHRYEVVSERDGRSTTRTEEREVTVVEGGTDGAVLEVVVRADGEAQVSTIDWSPAGSIVRTTRIDSGSATGSPCGWDPPFTDLGPLEQGAEWTIDSSCETEVAGLPSTFLVQGSGRVVFETTQEHGGETVRVWQVERNRTTTITAQVGTESIQQVAHELGTILVDPARGLVLRSDLTVTLSGSQEGQSRRVTTLIA